MNLKKGLVAAAISAGVAVSATACGPGYYPQSEYCVDNAGHVMPSNYCQPSYPGYGSYFVYYGYVHSHTYGVGGVIPRSYIVAGREVRANNSAGLKAAGIPAGGSFKNGATVKPTPAKPQSPPASGGMKSTPKSSTGTSKVGGFSGGTKSTFGGSTRSSFGGGFRSSGGRK